MDGSVATRYTDGIDRYQQMSAAGYDDQPSMIFYGELHGDKSILSDIAAEIEKVDPAGILHEGYSDHGAAVMAAQFDYQDMTDSIDAIADHLSERYDEGEQIGNGLLDRLDPDTPFRTAEADHDTIQTYLDEMRAEVDDDVLEAEIEHLIAESRYVSLREADERIAEIEGAYEPFKEQIWDYAGDIPVAGNDIDVTRLIETAHDYETPERREAALQAGLERTMIERNKTMAERTVSMASKVDGTVVSVVGAAHLSTPGIYEVILETDMDYAVHVPTSSLSETEQKEVRHRHSDLLCDDTGLAALRMQRQLRINRAGLVNMHQQD